MGTLGAVVAAAVRMVVAASTELVQRVAVEAGAAREMVTAVALSAVQTAVSVMGVAVAELREVAQTEVVERGLVEMAAVDTEVAVLARVAVAVTAPGMVEGTKGGAAVALDGVKETTV